MALLAEELVEEWLARQGFFTIRGVRVGHGEIDLLAVSVRGGRPVCRHVEVNGSVNPVNYLAPLPQATRKVSGRGASSAGKRPMEVMCAGVDEWIAKKYRDPAKVALRRALCDAQWTEELVVNQVKYEEELTVFRKKRVRVHRMATIVAELLNPADPLLTACGTDLVNLLAIGRSGKA